MKNRVLFTFCILHFTFLAFAQYDPSKVNKKAIETYNRAIEKAQDGQYAESIKLLEEAVQKDAKYVDAYLSLAGVYGQTKKHDLSVNYYEKSMAIDPAYTADYALPYSINLAALGQFEKALNVINQLFKT